MCVRICYCFFTHFAHAHILLRDRLPVDPEKKIQKAAHEHVLTLQVMNNVTIHLSQKNNKKRGSALLRSVSVALGMLRFRAHGRRAGGIWILGHFTSTPAWVGVACNLDLKCAEYAR